MDARHLLKWLLALTILLAVVMTVAAQGKAPASPAANLTESEPNNRVATADGLAPGDVIRAAIQSKTDIDLFRIDMSPSSALVLVDIDAQVNGSPLDAAMCLYIRVNWQLIEPHCSDNADGLDPLLLRRVYGPGGSNTGGPFYAVVQAADHPNVGGDTYTYTLSVYRPLLISAVTDGVVAGVPFQKSDVLAHYDFADGTEKWSLLFDASDVGVTQNVVALAATDPGSELVMALQGSQTLLMGDSATQRVTPYDTLWFDPGAEGGFGANTAGQWGLDRGGAYGLSAPGEKIDALALPYSASTVGAATFGSGLVARDEDISYLSYAELAFDGSRVPGLAAEDVVAADNDHAGRHFLTILGNGRVDGWVLTQKDIFTVDPETMRVIDLYWNGPAHHFNYNLDAFDAVD